MFKYIFVVLGIIIPILVQAKEVKRSHLSGNWFVYGVALYQPLDRVVTGGASNRQTVYKMGLSYGLGVGKDHLRMEFVRYMDKTRFLAAYDIFPCHIATPYVGYVYGRGLKAKDSIGMLKYSVDHGDAVLGITFQPIKFLNIYGEYLIRDSFFFAGARVRLPYTVK